MPTQLIEKRHLNRIFWLLKSRSSGITYHYDVIPYISAVPPEVTLVPTEKGTAVCKAAAGKPAAQISWTPEGDCVTEQEPSWGGGTVTVQSTCRWGGRHVLNVLSSCLTWRQ